MIWKSIKIVVLMNSMFRFFRFIIGLKEFYKLLYVLFICLLFNEYDRNLFLLWFRLDLTRLIIVSIFYYSLRFQSLDKYEKKKMSTVVVLDVLYEQLLKEKKQIRLYRFEKAYYTVIAKNHVNIVSRKLIESITTEIWCHIVSLRKSVLCNHITFRFCKAETRSKRTNSAENIWFFRILIDLILWQILVRSEKFDFAFFASMHVRRIRCIIFFIDFSIIFSFSHRIDIFYEFFTVKLHENRFIDVAKSIWNLWDSQWCYMMWLAFSFVIAELRQLIFASWCIFYSISNIRFHIDASFHENSKHDRNFSDARSHALQIDFTSYLKSWISIRSFLQFSHRCMI